MAASALAEIFLKELDEQRAVNFSRWRQIPSSATRRALSFVDSLPNQSPDSFGMQREVVRELVARAERTGPAVAERNPTLAEWIESASQPWHCGGSESEWALKGPKEKLALARELSRLRAASGCDAVRLVQHYRDVTETELAEAMQWKPIERRAFFASLKRHLGRLGAIVIPPLGSGSRFSVGRGVARLELEVEFASGTIEYSVGGFFANPRAVLIYEGIFGIGLGEWDMIRAEDIDSSCELLVGIVEDMLRWKASVSAT